MFLAYFDESGDAGVVNSPTQFFVLACILVPETDWLAYLDKLVALRRRLRQRYSVKTRPELKYHRHPTRSGSATGTELVTGETKASFSPPEATVDSALSESERSV